MAARATFALKAGLCVRRARLAIVTPDMRHSRRSQADFPLIGLSEFAQPPLDDDCRNTHLNNAGNISCRDVQRFGCDLKDGADIDLLTIDRVAVGIRPQATIKPLTDGPFPGILIA